MDTNFSPIENYPFLSPFLFTEDAQKIEKHKKDLQKKLLKVWRPLQINDSQILEYLASRERVFATVTSEYFEEQYQIIVDKSLSTKSSFETLAQNTRLLDSIILTAFEYAFKDLPILKEKTIEELKKEYRLKTRKLPKNIQKLTLTQKQIEKIESNSEDPDQRQQLKYYNSIEADLTREIKRLSDSLKDLKEQIPQAQNGEFKRDYLLNHLVIFARGGYGRAELSFASDRDLGYCLDTQQLSSGEAEIYRQLIIHIEHLLRIAGIETAHQYFELNKDLSRFEDPSTIHTIPAILESRVLLGSNHLANALKRRFFQILPYETFVLSQIRDFHDQTVPGLSNMNLKEDQGGLRSLQIPIWLAAATFGVFPNQTADMLALLIKKRIISPRQGFKLCQALEFLYDLRNFSATAVKFHLDDEAREGGVSEKDIEINIINDATERLYLLKKKRFQSVDDFDRYRQQMLNYIQDLSKVILQRLLDRTIVRTFSNFQVVVHLGKRQIVEINALEGLPQVPISLIFNDPTALLELFEYVGQSEYDLSFDLKDDMADLIRIITPDVIFSNRIQIAKCFTKLMLTPFAANAWRIMFEICEPINAESQPSTLMGCFIPETNKMRFLLRNLAYHQHPVCTHTLNALDRTQKELDRLKKDYQELFQYLEPKHILALKWGIIFHDVGKIDPQTDHEVSGTSIAVEALERIGYDDQEFFTLVSLLIVHHSTVVQLSKTSAYFDQALQSFFEIADRNLINVILLFLCNISDYISVSESNAHSTRSLRTFFEETYRVFAEMRSSQKQEDSMDFIQTYLDIKKTDLASDTRIDLLIKRSLRENIESVLLKPLERINKKERKLLEKSEIELQVLWRDLKLGSLDKHGTDQTTEKIIRIIRQSLSDKTLVKLTELYSPLINWFFASFPNRFLLSSPPGMVAENLTIFNKLKLPAIVNVITNSRGRLNGLLIYVHDMPQIHSKIAYTLNLKHLNIESAKINQIKFASGKVAFCYYIKVSKGREDNLIFPLELETSIRRNNPPALKIKPPTFLYNTKFQLEHLKDDKKGYMVNENNEASSADFPVWKGASRDKTEFSRSDKHYLRIKITAEDAPLVYYKMVSAFDRVGVPIQQAVITTIGHQVIDTFYITPDDYEKIVKSNFEESLKQALMSPSEI